MTSNMTYSVTIGVALKCLRKIHLNTQWGGASGIFGFWVASVSEAFSYLVRGKREGLVRESGHAKLPKQWQAEPFWKKLRKCRREREPDQWLPELLIWHLEGWANLKRTCYLWHVPWPEKFRNLDMLEIFVVRIENILVAKHIANFFLKKQPHCNLVHSL